MNATIGDMVGEAMDTASGGELVYTRFQPGTVLTPGTAALLRQGEEFFWILTAVASWVTCGTTMANGDGFDEEGMAAGDYTRLICRWHSMRHWMQHFELRRHGARGAELCVRGGADATEDDSETLHPIQRWIDAEIPWSDDAPLAVWAGRQELPNGKSVWVLMLPSER